jgi:hypothetical protein
VSAKRGKASTTRRQPRLDGYSRNHSGAGRFEHFRFAIPPSPILERRRGIGTVDRCTGRPVRQDTQHAARVDPRCRPRSGETCSRFSVTSLCFGAASGSGHGLDRITGDYISIAATPEGVRHIPHPVSGRRQLLVGYDSRNRQVSDACTPIDDSHYVNGMTGDKWWTYKPVTFSIQENNKEGPRHPISKDMFSGACGVERVDE